MSMSLPPGHHESHGPSRRTLLKGIGAGAGLAVGGTMLIPGTAQAHNTVPQYTIWGEPTYYQGTRTSFHYNAGFHTQLANWLSFYFSRTPITWQWPLQLHLLGVHVDKPGMHQYGRAIDFERIVFTNGTTGGRFNGFDCRYNEWKSKTGSALEVVRREYWAGVAGLNYHFKYVLHYLYNSEHHNHVHVDNEASGSGLSTFTTGTTSQVKFVQAALNYIWKIPTGIDGVWGPETDGNSAKVLQRVNYGGKLTTSQNHWLTFCRVSLLQGSTATTW
ncbi:twin-arginine translocation signal domain-containing protein [Kribbella sp. NPDC048915]|uniref:twin-arginine translocation signal domain-containing protein n=1 Tax=Kribbella sp. NPDC048915 TaxID=3155148 RepID=UPI0033C5C2A1